MLRHRRFSAVRTFAAAGLAAVCFTLGTHSQPACKYVETTPNASVTLKWGYTYKVDGKNQVQAFLCQ